MFGPNGTICFDQPAGADFYDALTYDPATNEVLKFPFGSTTGTLYRAAPTSRPAFWTNPKGGSWASASNWSGTPLTTVGTPIFGGTTSGTALVTLDGSCSAAALQFGDTSAASSYTISAGSGGLLTLGTSSGAPITVISGSHTISCADRPGRGLKRQHVGGNRPGPVGGVGESAGVSAAPSLSGNGVLVLSGTDTYTGGTTVESGTLYVTSSSALPAGSSLTVGAAVLSFSIRWPPRRRRMPRSAGSLPSLSRARSD